MKRLRAGLSPSVSGRREMPWRWRQRCRAERVRFGMGKRHRLAALRHVAVMV